VKEEDKEEKKNERRKRKKRRKKSLLGGQPVQEDLSSVVPQRVILCVDR